VFFRHIGLYVPVWALDAAQLDGGLELRVARPEERLGRGPDAPGVPGGRLVVADAGGALALLFGDVAPAHGVTPSTREIALFSVAVPGVPAIHVEEALWTVWDIVAG
jgi:DNA/RNA-binding domain of Phe-tRNA-synthetase-like protein